MDIFIIFFFILYNVGTYTVKRVPHIATSIYNTHLSIWNFSDIFFGSITQVSIDVSMRIVARNIRIHFTRVNGSTTTNFHIRNIKWIHLCYFRPYCLKRHGKYISILQSLTGTKSCAKHYSHNELCCPEIFLK